jgi:predicted  nucleic acid-binding Zn-ribbon protein
MSTKTIDVNIPESAIEELAQAVTSHLDLDSAISDSELSGRVDELERKLDDIDTGELVTQGDIHDLRSDIEDVESNVQDCASDERVNDLEEDIQGLNVRLDALESASNKARNDEGWPVTPEDMRGMKSEILDLVVQVTKIQGVLRNVCEALSGMSR